MRFAAPPEPSGASACAPLACARGCRNGSGLIVTPPFQHPRLHLDEIARAERGPERPAHLQPRAQGEPPQPGFLLALRDTNGDGKMDVQEKFGDSGATSI